MRLSSPAAAIAGLVLALAAACFARAADEAPPVPDASASATATASEKAVSDTPPPRRRARNVDLDAPVMERPGQAYTRQLRRDLETRSDQAQDEAMRTIDDVDVTRLPQGPVALRVHMASVWVPFTSESKEAIAGYPEIQKELRLGLQAVGRPTGR